MTPRTRAATSDDLDAIMAIENAVFAPDAWSRDIMASELASEHTAYFVVDDGSEIVAYAGVLAPRGSHDADIQTIAVSESARRSGLGRGLMYQLMDAATRQGATAAFLEVRADNPAARSLYESLGFERIGVRAGYYAGGIDAVVMRASLSPATPLEWEGSA